MTQEGERRLQSMPEDAMEFISMMIGSAQTGPVIVAEPKDAPEVWVPDSVPQVGGQPPTPPALGVVEQAPDLSGLGNYFASSSYAE